MRDPARINRILSALGTYWRANPDHRLGQIVVNVTGSSDPFYVEDDATEAALGQALAPTPEPADVDAAHRRWMAAAIAHEAEAWCVLKRENRVKGARAERDEIYRRMKVARGMAILCALLAALTIAWGPSSTTRGGVCAPIGGAR